MVIRRTDLHRRSTGGHQPTLFDDSHRLMAELQHIGLLGVELKGDQACGLGGVQGLANELSPWSIAHTAMCEHHKVPAGLQPNGVFRQVNTGVQ